MTKFFTILLIINGFFFSIKAQTIDTTFVNRNYSVDFFKNRYLHNNFEQFADNYHDFIIYQIETTGDFSSPDQYVFSINGGSYKWNNYKYNNFKINDLFFSGNSLHKLQMYENDVSIDIYNSSVIFNPRLNSNSNVLFQWNHGTLGDRIPNADKIINEITGHVSPYERLLKPIEYRRKVKNNFLLNINNNFKINNRSYFQNIYLNSGQRMLTDFDYSGISSYYPENYLQFHINGNLPSISKKIFDDNFYLFSYNNRDNLYGEFYYNKNETAKLNSFNLSVFGVKNQNYTTGLNFSAKSIIHNSLNFSRNFADIDGEGFEPWFTDGKSLEIEFYHNQVYKLTDKIGLSAELSNGLINFSPKYNNSYNTIYYQTNASDFTPLYYIERKHSAFNSSLHNNSLGLNIKNNFFRNKLIINGIFNFTIDGFTTEKENFIEPSWELFFYSNLKILKNLSININFGKKQLPFDFEYIKFFSGAYMSGKIYYWNDNNDNYFTENEKGHLFTTTGGNYHNISNNMIQPNEIFFDIPVEWKLNSKNTFSIIGQYRQYRDLWGIVFTKEPYKQGFYINENINIYKDQKPEIKPIYFLNNGEIYYTTSNNYSENIKKGNNTDNWLFSNPFYAGSTFKYEYQNNKLYISASITAYMLVGYGSMGNGVLHNNLSVLSESMANPNSYFYYTGRLDADRSYIGRLLISYNINDKLTTIFQFKYKDGQSFNSFGTKIFTDINGNNQIAIWNSNVKGDNPFTDQLSRREDCFYNSEIRIKYLLPLKNKKIEFNATVYNLLDLGFQLAEATFPPITDNGNRKVIDIQIPRGFLVSLTYQF